MAQVHSTLADAHAEGKVIPLRPRAEVPRGSNPLPPKSRRRYRRSSGTADGYIGRFQKPMRWMVFGKVIFPDLRPCWRCTLGANACATCQNQRRELPVPAPPWTG